MTYSNSQTAQQTPAFSPGLYDARVCGWESKNDFETKAAIYCLIWETPQGRIVEKMRINDPDTQKKMKAQDKARKLARMCGIQDWPASPKMDDLSRFLGCKAAIRVKLFSPDGVKSYPYVADHQMASAFTPQNELKSSETREPFKTREEQNDACPF